MRRFWWPSFLVIAANHLLATTGPFSHERLAIQMDLPGLAEKTLKRHILDAPPNGLECRCLLAQTALLRNDFKTMGDHLQWLVRDPSQAYLVALHQWFTAGKVNLLPLLFAQQATPLGQFLAEYNTILLQPMESIAWNAFWWQQRQRYPLKTFIRFYQLAFHMKLAVDPNVADPNQTNFFNWELLAQYFANQQQYTKADQCVQKQLPLCTTIIDKIRCMRWAIQLKQRLHEKTDALVSDYIALMEHHPQYLQTHWIPWLHHPDDTSTHLANALHALYQKHNAWAPAQSLQLLQTKHFIAANHFEEARQCLGDLETYEPSLKAAAYTLAAQLELTHASDRHYRMAAYWLSKASACTNDGRQSVWYAHMRAQCYCLAGDYKQAYVIYQQAIQTFPELVTEGLIEAYAYCGILYPLSANEFETQLTSLEQYPFFTKEMQRKLRFAWIQNAIEQNQWEAALAYLNQPIFHTASYRSIAQWLRGKCWLQLDAIERALEAWESVDLQPLSREQQADYLLWRSYAAQQWNDFDTMQTLLQKCLQLAPSDAIEIRTQATLLQAAYEAQQSHFNEATQLLVQWLPRTPDTWFPFVCFQAGCYAEHNMENHQQEAFQLFQRLITRYPDHPLANDARLKLGLLCMNQNQTASAKTIFEALLPKLTGAQRIWCHYLFQKCCHLLQQQPLTYTQQQLEQLLREAMPLALRLEISLQLAFIYKDLGQLDALQTHLWNVCSPLFEQPQQNFSVNEIYWFNRCLLTLAQYATDQTTAQQIYQLIVELDMPSTSLVQMYLEAQ